MSSYYTRINNAIPLPRDIKGYMKKTNIFHEILPFHLCNQSTLRIINIMKHILGLCMVLSTKQLSQSYICIKIMYKNYRETVFFTESFFCIFEIFSSFAFLGTLLAFDPCFAAGASCVAVSL